MILDRIVLDNVGLYSGRQTLELTPLGPNQPIILIGGLNGGGKTTLLESLHIGLYGRMAAVVQRNRRSYVELLRTLIHRKADPKEGASIEIHFRRVIEGRHHAIIIARRWHVDADDKIVEIVEARRDGVLDPVLSEQWDEYIEGYLPARLAPLFFFDGEQIEELADPEKAASLISLAVQTLLGLDLVDRLRDDLAVLARRKRMASRSVTERAQLEVLKTKADTAEAQVTAVNDEVVRNATLMQQLERDKSRLRERFSAEGGELHLRRDELEKERAKIAQTLANTLKQIRESIAGPAPLLLIETLLSATEIQAERELTAQREKIVCTAEIARDRHVLNELKSKLPSKTLSLVEAALLNNRPTIKEDVQVVLAPEETLPERLRSLREHILPRIRNELDSLTKEARTSRRRLDELDRQLARAPDADQLARIQHELTKIEVELRDTESQRAVLEDRFRQAQFESRSCSGALAKTLDAVATEVQTAEHDLRILQRIPSLDATMASFRSQVVSKHAGKLEALILESFQQLLRKPRLVTQLQIDPQHFNLHLTGSDGTALPIDRLSAGERQLLATSILWGLARASGRPVPTMIDTPLGRLDSSHRDHLVQRYFPIASHQVILLSTDEEIDLRRLQTLAPSISRTYRLEYDNQLQRTKIANGYLFEYAITS